ncbi:hypothetical protein LCGC14_2381520, partial [marine sediment metagenome]
KPGKQQIEIKIDYESLARLSLTVADVARNVRIAYDGEVVTSLRDGDEDVDFRVQLAAVAREDISYLLNLSIPNRQGRLIKLREVARLETGPGPTAYRHFDGERVISIVGDIDQDITTPLEVIGAVFEHFNVEEDWPGVQLLVGGGAQEAEEEEQAEGGGHGIHMPSPSFFPLIAAIALPIIATGLIYDAAIVAVGVAVLVVGIYGWALEPASE